MSASLIELLTGRVEAQTGLLAVREHAAEAVTVADPVHAEDFQLALTLLYELHYRGVEGVNDRWEWDPDLLGVRAGLEEVFERAVRERVHTMLTEFTGAAPETRPTGEQVAQTLLALTAPTSAPGLSTYLARQATADQYRELLVTRSIYHLKEADPHTFALPRLTGAPKAAMVEVQSDEYGGGRPDWIHADLFARTMRALGLDARYGHYLDQVPAVILAGVNAMSLFGLHRRLRGAVAGHLAAFEMTSTTPNRRYAQGLRRLGFGEAATLYFDEHVEADAVHEQIALRELVGALIEQQPELAADVLFGAATALVLDEEASGHLLSNWKAGRSALREQARVKVSAA
ncbi:hypothetical protein Kisp01_07170 [Kineosporia sp. NBRC 101677]|uniref:iron-containing redox enzyme family protein n=1 Tax=Kineosporia sp. NBRC 101677 TaxID=3032197 RepID=UPI0024A424E3|nr:iron-containing redox enzyme family protein [Kineosporia sp. NBRC 101677]GLY13701.1 hypothetical protein Kisp01_07170 [Kineosporia sp. NBRC 101677]